MGAWPSVQSDVTGDRQVTDRSFLTDASQSGTPHVCPYCIECGIAQYFRMRNTSVVLVNK
uniref:DUF1263 domain-containing protein n=1 Tax=Oryza sativa subsp. japonica TaxID=39947 RepID=Q6ZAH6_ORYSJ|nr:hypothetical protein [Oryza sativa Japonica Group]